MTCTSWAQEFGWGGGYPDRALLGFWPPSALLPVHSVDNTRMDLIIPGEQYFYLKARSVAERQRWLVALGSAKACLTDSRTQKEKGKYRLCSGLETLGISSGISGFSYLLSCFWPCSQLFVSCKCRVPLEFKPQLVSDSSLLAYHTRESTGIGARHNWIQIMAL